MEILSGGGGLGPKLQRLLWRYWDVQKVLPKTGNFFGNPFNTERLVTQEDPVSLVVFNVVVESVFRAVLL